MSLYETVFIARQDISGTQVDALADQFAGIIAEQGGEVKKRENWGLRNLAFRMKKNRKGHYVLFNVDAPSAAIVEMERNMRISEDILRYLTIRVDALEEGPSAVLQNRGRSDERDRDRGFGGDRDRDRDRGPRRDRDGRDAEPVAAVPAPVASEGVER
ncbi:MAG TPA: 30S ribosomal protein S6 [Stellaceae bacterium]